MPLALALTVTETASELGTERSASIVAVPLPSVALLVATAKLIAGGRSSSVMVTVCVVGDPIVAPVAASMVKTASSSSSSIESETIVRETVPVVCPAGITICAAAKV